jgi:LysM repeat protein
MSFFDDLKGRLQDRGQLAAPIAMGLIGVILIGYALFILTCVLPQVQSWRALVQQRRELQQTLAAMQQSQVEAPAHAQQRLDLARARLTEAASGFMGQAQAASALSMLYQHASASGVEIVNVENSSSPEEETRAYAAQMFSVQARGEVPALIYFVSSIEEATVDGYQITNVHLSKEEESGVLAMDVTIYTSPYADTPTLPAAAAPTGADELDLLEQRLAMAWAAGEWKQVTGLIEQMVGLDPSYGGGLTHELYLAHVNYGEQLLSSGEVVSAVIEFTAALQIDPGGTEAQAGLQRATATSTPSPTAQGAALAAPLPAQPVVYVVQPGDTLYGIAERYSTSVEAIVAANGLTDTQIFVGQELGIPTE